MSFTLVVNRTRQKPLIDSYYFYQGESIEVLDVRCDSVEEQESYYKENHGKNEIKEYEADVSALVSKELDNLDAKTRILPCYVINIDGKEIFIPETDSFTITDVNGNVVFKA